MRTKAMSSRTPITRSLLLLVLLLLVAVTWAQNGHNIATIDEYYDALGDEDVDDDEDMDGDYTITGVDDLEAVVAEAETTHDPMSLPTCLLCVCLRGSVYCDDNKLTKIPSLPRDTSYFYARYNAITSVEKKDFEGLDKLRRVNLSNNRIKSVDPGTFDGLPVLEELLISNNDLTELPGLPISLVTLAANWNSIIDSGLPSDGLAKMENLKDLYLGNNQLEHVPHGLPENLQLLHLQHNKIDSIANDTFCKPGDKTYVRKSLQDVRLDNNPVLLGSAPDAYICLRRLPTGRF